MISPCTTFNDHEGSTKSYSYMKEHDEMLHELDFVPSYDDISVEIAEGEVQDVEHARRLARCASRSWAAITIRPMKFDALTALDEAEKKDEVLTGVLYVNTEKPNFLEMLNMDDAPLATLPESKIAAAEGSARPGDGRAAVAGAGIRSGKAFMRRHVEHGVCAALVRAFAPLSAAADSNLIVTPPCGMPLRRAVETWGVIMCTETMPVTISDEVLTAAHLSEPELKQELALTLFQLERLTLAQASRLAGVGQLAFQALMAERRIPVHYGVEEFREDLQSLRLRNGLDRRLRHVAVLNLARIGRLDLLALLYHRVLIPSAVYAELTAPGATCLPRSTLTHASG